MKLRIIVLAAAALTAFSCGNRNGNTQAGVVTAGEWCDLNHWAFWSRLMQDADSAGYADKSGYWRFYTNNRVAVRVTDADGNPMVGMQVELLRSTSESDEIEYKRLKALYEEGGLSQSDFETAELGYKVRKTNYQNLLENTILRTPITGFVTARNFDQGDMFSMSAPLFTVQQVVPVKLLVGISESEYTKVKKGQSVAIKADALPGRSFTGKVERLYPTIDAATHTFRAEVHVANTDRVLRPGMYARVTVNYGSNHSIVVPDLCIVKQEGTGQRFVYLLKADNTVSYVPVTLGRHIGMEYEVLEGISEGDQVVYKGQAALKDGVKVVVLNK